MPKTILYIHQSAELYGSDKALSFLVDKINKDPNFKTIVVLPNHGPLKDILENNGIRVVIYPVIKVSRSFFKFKNIIVLPYTIAKTIKKFNKEIENEKIDIIHSNTLAVLLGAFYAKRYKIKHVWHVHEIIKKPKLASLAYPFLVSSLSNKVVFNSKASQVFLCRNNRWLLNKSIINLNGMDRNVPIISNIEQIRIRKELFGAGSSDIVLALVGRISKWKGQMLLLESFSKLSKKHHNLKLIFVGSAPPNQHFLVEELQNEIEKLKLNDFCRIIPFQESIWSIWDSVDIAVVPSTEPEPFGLVALEAMLSKKPVIAANHGGLNEIVLNNISGYLFSPNDRNDLIKDIEQLISNKKNLRKFGLNGYERAITDFSLQRHVEKFVEIYHNI